VCEAAPTFGPYRRSAPRGSLFEWSVRTLRRGLNFTLTTSHGDLDLLGEIAGGGTYENLCPQIIGVEVFGRTQRCLKSGLADRTKRAAVDPGISKFSPSSRRERRSAKRIVGRCQLHPHGACERSVD
jgi:hypothetical protein